MPPEADKAAREGRTRFPLQLIPSSPHVAVLWTRGAISGLFVPASNATLIKRHGQN